MAKAYEVGDRVVVADGPGFTLGEGTVVAVNDFGKGYELTLEVIMDEDGLHKVFAARQVVQASARNVQ